MKKIFPILVLVLVAGGAWYFLSSSKPGNGGQAGGTAVQGTQSPAQQGAAETSTAGGSSATAAGAGSLAGQGGESEEATADENVKPATDLYKNANDAFEAVRKGATDYDDLILEQFAELGEDCSWCPEFYGMVKQSMLSGDTPDDQKSYYAEILSVSGKPENLAVLIDAIKGAKDQDAADVYAEALEVAMGNEKTVGFLGEQLDTDNQVLKESLIAAITNHGSPLAIDLLYKETVKHKDADGYYSLGIGLGEVIPEEQSLPFLTNLANKRDQYSHLAVKALLNYGTDGLRIVMDTLSNSSDSEFDRKMLEDAIDHVNYEEETEQLVKNVLKTEKNPVVVDFAKQILQEFQVEGAEEGGFSKAE